MTLTASAAPGARTAKARPLRVAVVGCGAISRDFHLPVLAGHDRVEIAALVDRDVDRAAALASSYGVREVLDDASRLTTAVADAALVATPPAHHAPCCIALARRGLHVLVEKPMAVFAADAEAMATAAVEAGVTLGAAYFRRLFPAVGLLRAAIGDEALGRPLAFDVEEGGEYGWALATLGNLRKADGGGGVLIDIGSHVLDLILHLFPGAPEVLSYRDDSIGGVEADCELVLRVGSGHGRHDVEGRVVLSRSRRLRNTLRVVCERGTLELRVGERYRLAVRPHDLVLDDPETGMPRPFALEASWADAVDEQGYAAYRAVFDDWLDAIESGCAPRLDAASACRTVGLIESCYRARTRLALPWETGATPVGSEVASSPGFVPSAPAGPPARAGRALLTGASGYIGTRVAEWLGREGGWEVRALVHRPSRAARLARLPVEMVQADLTSPADVAEAIRGCDAVVHAAVGTNYGSRRDVFAVTVRGTKALAEAARAAGVGRFVHLSTLAVHGRRAAGVVDESTPIDPDRGSDYAESKAAAERAVARAATRGLPAVILRIANVYGPFNSTLVGRPLGQLLRGRLAVIGGDRKPSNTVYLDDVAAAIEGALRAEAAGVVGEAFVIGGFDAMTWAEFYDHFAKRLGVAGVRTPDLPAVESRGGRAGPARRVMSWWRDVATLARSPELRAFARRTLESDPIGTVPRWLLERSPGLDRRLRRAMGVDVAHVYRPGSPSDRDDDGGGMTMNPAGFLASSAKAARLLGYRPSVPREEAMEATLAWYAWWSRRPLADAIGLPIAGRSPEPCR